MPRWLPKVLTRVRGLAAKGRVRFTLKALRELAVVYVKVNLRDDCLVVSFHEDEGGRNENE